MSALDRHLRAAATALGAALSSPGIRRLELAWALAILADWMFVVGVLVQAYATGGAAAAGLVGVARMLPSAAAAPLASRIADRGSRERVLAGALVVRTAAVGAAAAALATDAPLAVLLLLVAVAGTAGSLVRPTHHALLPALARSPEELVAANVATTTGEGVGTLAGPALAGLLLTMASPAAVLAVAAGALAGTVALVAGLRPDDAGARRSVASAGWVRDLGAGVEVLRQRSGPRIIVAGFASQTLVRGVLTVLTVAASIELLGLGDAGVGMLTAAMGLGGLAGGVLAVGLVSRERIGPAFGVALALWGAPIAIIGLVPQPPLALLLLAGIGASNAVLDVAGFSLLQRTVPNEVRASVLGVLEGLIGLTVAVGGVLAGPLAVGLGVRNALIVTGLALPLVALVGWRRMAAADDASLVPEEQRRLLAGVPMFAPLSIAAIEQLAGSLIPVRVAAGATLIREGEPGDRFYILAEGTVEVTSGGRLLRTEGPGAYVGEIALLRAVPRTATVTALTDVRAFAVESADFVAAATGTPAAATAARQVVEERLAGTA